MLVVALSRRYLAILPRFGAPSERRRSGDRFGFTFADTERALITKRECAALHWPESENGAAIGGATMLDGEIDRAIRGHDIPADMPPLGRLRIGDGAVPSVGFSR